MELTISLGYGAWILLIGASLVFGLIAQFVGETRTGYEWLVDSIAFGIGALVASEFVIGWRTIEPTWDQMALVLALLGGLVVGVIAEVATRLATGGTYTTHHGPVSA